MNQISRICPVTDAEAERIARGGALADLAAHITAVPATEAPGAGSPPHRGERRGAGRRRWLLAAPLVAGVAVAAVLVAGLAGSAGPGSRHRSGSAAASPSASGKPRPEATGGSPVQTAQALSFTTSDGWITVIVRNPLADEAKYRAEFAAHHLDITFNLVPASPSIVGTVVYIGQSAGSSPIQTITAKGRCYTGGGGAECPVGVRIPADFHGQAEIVFGRAARPGEQYESTAVSATAPGEVLHGLTFAGDTVTQVLALLRARHVTVGVYNFDKQGYGGVNVHHVPGSWYVYDAIPWAPGQVMLFVGPTRTQPPAGPPQPGIPTPSPTG
jgi:hypothetical protein